MIARRLLKLAVTEFVSTTVGEIARGVGKALGDKLGRKIYVPPKDDEDESDDGPKKP